MTVFYGGITWVLSLCHSISLSQHTGTEVTKRDTEGGDESWESGERRIKVAGLYMEDESRRRDRKLWHNECATRGE